MSMLDDDDNVRAVALIAHALAGVLDDHVLTGLDAIPRVRPPSSRGTAPREKMLAPTRASSASTRVDASEDDDDQDSRPAVDDKPNGATSSREFTGSMSTDVDVHVARPHTTTMTTGPRRDDDPTPEAAPTSSAVASKGAGTDADDLSAALASSLSASSSPTVATTTPSLESRQKIAARTREQIDALHAQERPAGEKLAILENDIVGACTRCKLHRGRSNVVFGAGNPNAKLMFIGSAPGADEDRQGNPFVGPAGDLLTRVIEKMQFSRQDVYVANILKCRPPNDRDPEADEVDVCEEFLRAQVRSVNPRVIVALGTQATQTLLHTRSTIANLHGRWFTYEGIDLIPTFSPAYLHREPSKRNLAWADFQQVMRLFHREAQPDDRGRR